MNSSSPHRHATLLIVLLAALVVVLWVANLFVGTVKIPASEVWHIITGQEASRESWRYIVIESRLPQCIVAALAGAALAVAGLLLQTVFNNPLAGPSILGIDTGASLGVALVMLTGIATGGIGEGLVTIGGAFVGAVTIMGIILLFSTVMRDNLMLLIIGIMVGYLASSLISLLNFFATSQQVHAFTVWGMGNLGGVTLQQLPLFATMALVGLIIAALLAKPLNALLLGARYARNLGVNITLTRNLLLIATGLLTATTTAYCGPIAFIGLSVPHIARLVLRSSNHNRLLPVTMLCGAAVLLVCNLISTLPATGIIPINAVTPLVGAPIIIYVIVNQRRINYFNG